MELLITECEFNQLSGKKQVSLRCLFCGIEFFQRKEILIKSLNKFNNAGYCSRKCCNKAKATKVEVNCKNCGKMVLRYPSYIKANKHTFCSYSCHAKYKNKNKNTGSIRSKLEVFIEKKIKEEFANLPYHPNDRKILGGLELDFYFPTLKLAVEFNGITHYEPIYGLDRLERSVDSDKRKMILCHEKGIELAVIDISMCKNFSKKWGIVFFNEIKTIIKPIFENYSQ